MTPNSLERPLRLGLLYLALVVAWNAGGLVQIARGLPAPGPVASPQVIAFSLASAAGLFAGARRWPVLFAGLCLVMVVAAAPSVGKIFTLDPALWPSDAWRYAGAAVNALGVAAGAWGMAAWVRLRWGA